MADGVLSDTYWPNVDATNVHTLQYVVTDGSTFTDLQTRDMTYRVVPDPTGMSCTIVASSTAHHYSITTTYIADPARDAVLMRTRFRGPSGDQVYVTLDPLAGGTGGGGSQNAGGNSASLVGSVPVDANTNTVTNASNRDYAVKTFEALQSSRGFGAESVGYAGSASDGVQMLDTAHQLTPYDSAPDGHVTLTAQLNLRHGRSTNLALGFGQTQDQALAVAGAAVNQRFKPVWRAYEAQWQRYDSHLRRPASWLGRSTAQEYYASVNVVKASEDKQFPGAIAAGLDSPVGPVGPRGQRHQRPAHVLRLLPRGVRARPVRGVHRAARRRRRPDRPGRHDVPVRPPAAVRRLDAAQLAGERQARARHRRPPARRDLVSDPDGLAVGPGP